MSDELRLSVTLTRGNRTLPVDSQEWRILRQKVMERDNYTCRFCGVRSLKYMVCDHTNGRADDNRLENLGVNCPPCDSIRHCGFGGLKGYIGLYISDMPQVEIVRKTLAYYRSYRKVPPATHIDQFAMSTPPGTIIQFANVLGAPQVVGHFKDAMETINKFRGFFEEPAEELFRRIV